MRLFTSLAAVLLGLCVASTVPGQTTVATDPVGFTTTSCPANSDTYISIPFIRPIEFSGSIATISGSTITVNGTPGWTTNQFVYAGSAQPKHYYVLIGSGGSSNAKEGHTYFLSGNGSNTLTVETSTDTLSGITADTSILVIPYWTPATIFPGSDANTSFTPTTSSSSYQTQIRIPNGSTPGIDQPNAVYFFSNNVDGTAGNVGWRQVGDNITSHDDDPLLPYSYFIVRNTNGAPSRSFTASGAVLMKKIAVPLATSAAQPQDNPVAMIRPINVPLNATGLSPIDNSMLPNDQLLLFDNTVAGFNKTPSKSYYFDVGWRVTGDPNTDHGNDLIPAGAAMLIRKASASSSQTVFWVNSPSYTGTQAVQPLQVVSRKTHGSAGNYDINLPYTSPRGVECRGSGPVNDYTLVFDFPNLLQSVGDTSVAHDPSSGTGTVSSSMIDPSDHHKYIVNLTNVSTRQYLTVTLINVNDGVNNVTNVIGPQMGVLVGDVTANGFVTNTDVGAVKGRVNPSVPFAGREDESANGFVTNTDVGITKGQVDPAHGLPSPP